MITLRNISIVFKTVLICGAFLFARHSVGAEVAGELLESIDSGKKLYTANCTLCHGTTGQGDGRMAKVITEPPPADFTKSKRSKAYMKKMVTYGGEVMGRSPQMPVWGQELNEKQVQAVVDYVFSLRAN